MSQTIEGPKELVSTVVRAVDRHQLGDLQSWQAERTTAENVSQFVGGTIVAAILGAVGGFGLWGAFQIKIGGHHLVLVGVAAIAIVVIVFAVVLLGMSVKALFSGVQATYAFTYAVVQAERHDAEVILWSHIDHLQVTLNRTGAPSAYRIVANDGRTIELRHAEVTAANSDNLGRQVLSAVEQLNRPIVRADPDPGAS